MASSGLYIKIEIYYQIMKVIAKNICNHRLSNINNKVYFFYLVLAPWSWLDIIVLKILAIEILLMICIDENVWQYYIIVPNMSVNYKKQIMITSIKLGMKYSIYHVLSEECKIFHKI